MDAGAAGRFAGVERRGAGFDARFAGRFLDAADFRDAPLFFLAEDFFDDFREAFLRAGMDRLPVRVRPAPEVRPSGCGGSGGHALSDRSGTAPVGSIMPYRIETAQGGP